MSILINNLSKSYDGNNYAIKNLNLEINNGVFGLLGQNGAGKTTLMKILISLVPKSSGSVLVNGMELNEKNKYDIRRQIGYLPQEFGFYPNLTVYECLDYIGILDEIEKKERKKRIDEILKKVNLENEKNKKFKNLSGGMKRRLGLAQAMIKNPKILVVDEPTTGLDPEERIRIRNIISDFSLDNIVIFSTHIIEDIASTTNTIGILEKGCLLYLGTTNELIKKSLNKIWKINANNNEELKEIKNKFFVISSIHTYNAIEVKVISEEKPKDDAMLLNPTIEDAYMYTIEKRSY